MARPEDQPQPAGPEPVPAPEPTVQLPPWPELETALRSRRPERPEAAPADQVLVVYAGTHLGRVFPLHPGVNVLGRSPAVDVPLADEEVSRLHAWITVALGSAGSDIVLEDQGSTNGTFVNDRQATGPIRLAPGDRIALGNHVLKLVAMDALERAFYSELLDQSTRDPLTGLNNRRATLEELQGRFGLSRRHDRPLAVVMCDLDHFKDINDSLGHGAGDLVLAEFGRRVKSNLRSTDLAGRIGGEEFLLILPETSLDGALWLAERIRSAISDVPFEPGCEGLRVTCSLGVAVRTRADRDGGALMARADGALYLAKGGGRNQVVPAAP